MRLAQPISDGQALTYSVIKIPGCSDVSLGFDILSEEPVVGARRYCNKILVHECVAVPAISPIALTKAEFLATDDPCYSYFNIFKSSETEDQISPSIELQLNDDDEVIGIIVSFTTSDTCCQPPRLAFKLYGYTSDTERILLATGNLGITQCNCPDGTDRDVWTDVGW